MSHDEFQTINAIGRSSPFGQRLDNFPFKQLSGVISENMAAVTRGIAAAFAPWS
jgi:hypothetical protein